MGIGTSTPSGAADSRERSQSAPPAAGLRPGDVVERYLVEGIAGRGGFAVVYRVRHRELDSLRALKVPTRDADRGALVREGRIQARLRHPNLVPVTDVIDVGAGAVGLVMEYVEGPSLKAWLRSSALEIEEIEAIFRGLVEGVGGAHEAGIVHRDLKPGNVLLARQGGRLVPRVTDFGLAGVLAGASLEMNRGGCGTPAYMAPEQRIDAADVDHRADIFSLGCVLYEMIAGRAPFSSGPDEGTIDEAPAAGYAPLTGEQAPRHLRAAVEACLQERPEARPQSCAALLHLLEASTSVSAAPPRHNLPREVDAFVGRARELAMALGMGRGELLTLIGPGGAGKTRLALRVARAGLERWPGGAWFCDLSEARSPETAAAAVAVALDAPLGDVEPQRQLGLAIRAQGRALFVLDNFEQIARSAAETVAVWRQAAPEAAFLVTSREPLLLQGERLLSVDPLPVPASATVDGVHQSDAAELFTRRVRQLRPDFTVDEENAADVAALVTMLDGLPLAIELAAARSRLYTPRQLLERLGRRFELLRSRRRDIPGRHATLRGAIAWSWEMLEPWERAAMAHASVFEGGFSARWAEAVVDLSRWPDAPPVDAVLEELVNKSLLQTWTLSARSGGRVEDDAPRFTALVSIRAYAAEALVGDERRGAEIRHEGMMSRLGDDAALAALEQHGGAEHRWALTFALDDLRSACRRGLDRPGPEAAQRAARACLAAMEVSLIRGPFLESAALADRVLERPLPDAARLALLLQLGRTLRLAGAFERAEAALRAALAMGSDVDGAALNNLGLLLQDRGALEEAERCLRGALARAEASGGPRWRGIVTGNLGRLLRARGELLEAERRYLEALELHRAVGNVNFEGITLSELGLLELQLGHLGRSQLHLEAALGAHLELGNRRSEGITLGFLGQLHQALGDLEESRRLHLGALERHRQVGNRRSDARALCELGRVALAQGRDRAARRWLDRAEALAEEVGAVVICGEVLTLRGVIVSRGGGDAEAYFERAEYLLGTAGDRWALAWLQRWRGEHAASRGDTSRAREAEEACRRLITEMGLSTDSPLLLSLNRSLWGAQL